MTMEPRSHRLIILLCVWCLLGAGRLLTVVNADMPRVEVRLLTSDDSIREGGMVEMRCIGRDLQNSNYDVGWDIGTGNAQQRLRLGDVTEPGVTSRYTFETITSSQISLQYFNINDLRRNDSNVYTCNLYEYPQGGRVQIIDSESVTISVLYFPSETFPMCFPDGPITVDNGTELNMRCTSETGNPSVTMEVSSSCLGDQSMCFPTWTAVNNSETISMSLNRTATAADENVTFVCFISSASFPDRSNLCTIGPITVREDTPTTKQTLIATSTPSQQSASPSSPDIALIAGAFAGGVATVLLIIVAILIPVWIYRKLRVKHRPQIPAPNAEMPTDRQETEDYTGLQGIGATKRDYMGLTPRDSHDQSTHCQPREGLQGTTKETNTDAYMELQPTNNKNTEYMGLKETKSNPANYAYCQTIQCEEDGKDYENLEDKNLQYEMVTAPRNQDKQYENIPKL